MICYMLYFYISISSTCILHIFREKCVCIIIFCLSCLLICFPGQLGEVSLPCTLPEANSSHLQIWMVGRRSFPFGARSIFRCYISVREDNHQQKWYQQLDVSGICWLKGVWEGYLCPGYQEIWTEVECMSHLGSMGLTCLFTWFLRRKFQNIKHIWLYSCNIKQAYLPKSI